ncbi:MAG: hypothetical protein ACRD1T_04195 [Acidimicrobiia bacterium]
MPNVKWGEPGKPPCALADVIPVGTIANVTKGAGWFADEDNNGGSQQIPFDDPRAVWKTVHLTFSVERQWGVAKAPSDVRVGLAMGGKADFARVASDLKSLGRVVLFLYKDSPVFAYEPYLFAIQEDGGMIATVDSEGRLALPFLDSARAARLLEQTPTLDALAAAARDPERTIELAQVGGALVRVKPTG